MQSLEILSKELIHLWKLRNFQKKVSYRMLWLLLSNWFYNDFKLNLLLKHFHLWWTLISNDHKRIQQKTLRFFSFICLSSFDKLTKKYFIKFLKKKTQSYCDHHFNFRMSGNQALTRWDFHTMNHYSEKRKHSDVFADAYTKPSQNIAWIAMKWMW